MISQLFYAFYLGTTLILSSRTLFPSTAIETLDLAESGLADGMTAAPSLLTEMVRDPNMLQRVRRLSYILIGSTIMGKSEVETLTQKGGPRLFNVYGSTELAPQTQNSVSADDWAYVSFAPGAGVHMEHEMDETYELIIKRHAPEEQEKYEIPSVFCSFPEKQIFRSGDLFTPHPDKPGLWKFLGRKDDKISLANGQSVNVAPLEDVINSCPGVDAAILGGEGRSNTILLVVPHEGEDPERLKEELKPYVEKANKLCNALFAIRQDRLLVIPPKGKLKSVTPKGSINRRQTLEEFGKELEF